MQADDLVRFRAMMGWSQQATAEALGYSRRNYQLMENGELTIRANTSLACAAIALGITKYDGPTATAQPRHSKGRK